MSWRRVSKPVPIAIIENPNEGKEERTYSSKLALERKKGNRKAKDERESNEINAIAFRIKKEMGKVVSSNDSKEEKEIDRKIGKLARIEWMEERRKRGMIDGVFVNKEKDVYHSSTFYHSSEGSGSGHKESGYEGFGY